MKHLDKDKPEKCSDVAGKLPFDLRLVSDCKQCESSPNAINTIVAVENNKYWK